MEVAELVLEYLKALLTWPVMGLTVFLTFLLLFRAELSGLIERIENARFPGGTEFSTPQKHNLEMEREERKPPSQDEDHSPNLADILDSEQIKVVEDRLKHLDSLAKYWEYNYLNLFLVPNSQRVLDWFVGTGNPVPKQTFHSVWSTIIHSEKERKAILQALGNHHLIYEDDEERLFLTPKGQEYHALRQPNISSG